MRIKNFTTERNIQFSIKELYLPCFLALIASILILHPARADDVIAKHGDWTVSYTDNRESVVATTRNQDRLVFGFVCKPANEPDCIIGAYFLARCSENSKVSSSILIDNKKITGWTANCESAENPETGENDRMLISSGLGGDSVDELLSMMTAGKSLSVTIEAKSGNTIRSDFSLNGYSATSNEMIKVLGWNSAGSNGIGGGGSGDGEKSSGTNAKTDLEDKKWRF